MIHRFTQSVEEAFRRTKTLLWPIQMKIWFPIFFLNVLTGGFGMSSFRMPAIPSHSAAPQTPLRQKVSALTESAKIVYRENKKTFFTLAGSLVGIFCLVSLLWIWVSARLRMVLIQCLLTQDVSIRKHWKQTQRLGQSFFWFNVWAMMGLLVPVTATAATVGFGVWKHAAVLKAHWVLATLAGISAACFFFLVAIIVVMVVRLLPAYMALTDQTWTQAFRNVLAQGRTGIFKALGYAGLNLLLAVGVGIAASIATVLALLVLGLVLVPLALLGGLAIKWLGVSKILLGVLGILLAIPVFLVVIVLINVPSETLKNYAVINLLEELIPKPR